MIHGGSKHRLFSPKPGRLGAVGAVGQVKDGSERMHVGAPEGQTVKGIEGARRSPEFGRSVGVFFFKCMFVFCLLFWYVFFVLFAFLGL